LQAWPQHKVWHKQQKKLDPKMRDEPTRQVVQRQTQQQAEKQAQQAEATGGEYDESLAAGMRFHAEGDFRRAARYYKKAIRLRPGNPSLLFNLGAILATQGCCAEAALQYLAASEEYLRMLAESMAAAHIRASGCSAEADYHAARLQESLGDPRLLAEKWADAKVNAFEMYCNRICANVSKPEWWSDDELKKLSVQVIDRAPNSYLAHAMRAKVLAHPEGEPVWEYGPRSIADLREAGKHFERAAELAELTFSESSSIAKGCNRNASLCRERVKRVDEIIAHFDDLIDACKTATDVTDCLEVIAGVMKRYRLMCEVQQGGCAIRSICDPVAQQACPEVLEAIVSAMRQHPENKGVQDQASAALAVLRRSHAM